ncbi:MAG: haloacid dehalogenase [Gemmataceae bacterium]|mgnify:CR=1 FL=1
MRGRRVAGLVIDIDGTLADTFPHLFASFRHAVAPWVRRAPSDAEIVATFGPPERGCIQALLSHAELALPQALTHLDEAVQRFHAYYRAHHDRVRLFPGVAELLRAVRAAGLKVAIFTGKGRSSAEYTLQRLGISDYDGLVAGDDVTHPKPHPEGILRAAQMLALPASELVVVGDHPADIEAGRRAGAVTAGALWGAFDAHAVLAAQPDWILRSPEELLALLARPESGRQPTS